jgi:hypothetical protein
MNVHVKSDMTQACVPDFLQGGGELGAAMRAFDWSATSLGPPDGWPQTLRTGLRIILASRQPMWLWWGPQLIHFYNDAYRFVLHDKHPDALGKPARDVWKEIWPQIQGRIGAAMKGEASYSEAELLVMNRRGYAEETYYTFSFSPVPGDDGAVGGIICANTDDTDRVIGTRRLALLRELALRTWDANTVAEVFSLSARALGTDPRDMPFTLLYRFEDAGARAILCGASGVEMGGTIAPQSIALDGTAPWPLGEVLRTGARRVVTGLAEKFPDLPRGPWPEAAQEALVLLSTMTFRKDELDSLHQLAKSGKLQPGVWTQLNW